MTHTEPGFIAAMEDLKDLLSGVKKEASQEAVPIQMLELFEEDQWPELMIEFQPTLATFSAEFDVVSAHQAAADVSGLDTTASDQTLHWIIFKLDETIYIRKSDDMEAAAVAAAGAKLCLSKIASRLWPEDDLELQRARLHEMLLNWMKEELVIDIGVPLPEDAEYDNSI